MARITFDPGMFSARLVLDMPVDTPDGQGGVTTAFAPVTTLWASVEPVAARNEDVADEKRVAVTHRVTVRHRDDIGSGMRLRQGLRHFAIETVRDPGGDGRYLVCDCREEGR